MLRSLEISLKTFNLNMFTKEESYKELRFLPKDIGKIVDLCWCWDGRTK